MKELGDILTQGTSLPSFTMFRENLHPEELLQSVTDGQTDRHGVVKELLVIAKWYLVIYIKKKHLKFAIQGSTKSMEVAKIHWECLCKFSMHVILVTNKNLFF